ncbi:hypothetical protein ACI65C_007264 [Semiaphis heraclei]
MTAECGGPAAMMANYIGHNGYPQPEIVAIATGGKPNVVVSPATLAADCFDIKFGSVLQESPPPPSMSVVDLTNLDTIAEADDSVEV